MENISYRLQNYTTFLRYRLQNYTSTKPNHMGHFSVLSSKLHYFLNSIIFKITLAASNWNIRLPKPRFNEAFSVLSSKLHYFFWYRLQNYISKKNRVIPVLITKILKY